MNASDRTKRIVDKILSALADEMSEAHPLDYLKEFSHAVIATVYAFAKGFSIPAPAIEVFLQALAKDVALHLQGDGSDEVTEKDFIDAYIALAKGFGFYVGACGCCDSPFISKQETHGPTFVDGHLAGPEYDDIAGHEAHLRGLSCLNCDNGGCYIKARYRFPDGKLLCAECGKELDG